MILTTAKEYVIEVGGDHMHPEPQCLVVHVREVFYPDGQALHTWDGGVCLATFVAADPALVRGKHVLELGAGSGIPSIVASLMGAASCTATERDDARTLDNLRANVAANQANVAVTACDWSHGTHMDDKHAALLVGVDVILGADVLYSSEDFDPVLRTVAAAMAANPNAVFYTTYQERSNRRSLSPHLSKHGLVAELVPLTSFLHAAHTHHGTVTLHAPASAPAPAPAPSPAPASAPAPAPAEDSAGAGDADQGSPSKRVRFNDKDDREGDTGKAEGPQGPKEARAPVKTFDSIYLIKITKSVV